MANGKFSACLFFTNGDLVVVVGRGGVTVACEGGTGAMGPGGEIGAYMETESNFCKESRYDFFVV